MHSITDLAWRSLSANRLRSALSICAVMMGVAIASGSDTLARSIKAGILQTEELQTIMSGMLAMMDPMLSFVSAVILVAAGFLIFNVFNMAITRQRQQIGSLRLLGMTRDQMRRVILLEGLIIALSGATLGALISPPFSAGLLLLVKQITGPLLAYADVPPDAGVLFWAWLGGGLAALLACWLPARRAMQIAPLDALRQPEAGGVEALDLRRFWPIALLAAALLLGVLLLRPSRWLVEPWDTLAALFFVLLWCSLVARLVPLVLHGLSYLLRRVGASATLRLIGENLQRARGRVTMTVVSFMLAVMVLTGLTGFLQFFMTYGVMETLRSVTQHGSFLVTRLDMLSGWDGIVSRRMDSIFLSDEQLNAVAEALGEDAAYAPLYFAVVPELSAFGSGFFSYMMNADQLQALGTMFFTFSEGDWETALPILRAGCGVLVAPLITNRHRVSLGDTLPVTGLNGTVNCTIAGIGTSAANTSIISDTLRHELVRDNPVMLFVVPRAGIASEALQARLEGPIQAHPPLAVLRMDQYSELMESSTLMISATFNLMLLLALLAAALAVVNTMLISVEERRREIGLLRAVGATQAQVRRILTGEAVLMGLAGGGLGGLAGLGIVALIVSTYGSSTFATVQQASTLQILSVSLAPALLVMAFGLLAAPLVALLAAWSPTVQILRQQPIESLALD